MRIRTIPFHLIIFLLLSGFTMSAIACPSPDCGDCCHWVSTGPGPSDGYCDLNLAVECGDCQGGCYNPCNNCVSCSCVWDCTPTQFCCNDTCCNAGQNCCGGSCCSNTCCNGICCSAGQACCNGSCCDKVWTKETIDSYIEPCSSCDNDATPICDGTTKELGSYDTCLNVGVGQGEHCECTMALLPVGYIYNCKINWDVTKLLWCAAQGIECAIECAGSGFDAYTCAQCLVGIDDCGTGFMEFCDFVEECEKNPFTGLEWKEGVFSSFGC